MASKYTQGALLRASKQARRLADDAEQGKIILAAELREVIEVMERAISIERAYFADRDAVDDMTNWDHTPVMFAAGFAAHGKLLDTFNFDHAQINALTPKQIRLLAALA